MPSTKSLRETRKSSMDFIARFEMFGAAILPFPCGGHGGGSQSHGPSSSVAWERGGGWGGAILMNSRSRPAGEAPAGGAGWTRGSWKWSPCREVRADRPRLSALGECEQAPPSPWGLWEAEPLSQRAPQVRGQGEAMSFLPPDLPLPPRHWPPVQPPLPPTLVIHPPLLWTLVGSQLPRVVGTQIPPSSALGD